LTAFFFKVARAKYLESQNTIRREILTKKIEKNSGRIIEELVWGVPKGSKCSLITGTISCSKHRSDFSFQVEAQGLIDFWQENFKVQVEARSGVLRIHHEGGTSSLYFLYIYLIFPLV
jgi:meiotic recombination protein REC8, fungi type